jgi:hypothetical protein
MRQSLAVRRLGCLLAVGAAAAVAETSHLRGPRTDGKCDRRDEEYLQSMLSVAAAACAPSLLSSPPACQSICRNALSKGVDLMPVHMECMAQINAAPPVSVTYSVVTQEVVDFMRSVTTLNQCELRGVCVVWGGGVG